jgi:hypothetical protein
MQIITEAIVVGRADPDSWVSYSRRRSTYSYDTVVPAVDQLAQAGLFEHEKVAPGNLGRPGPIKPAAERKPAAIKDAMQLVGSRTNRNAANRCRFAFADRASPEAERCGEDCVVYFFEAPSPTARTLCLVVIYEIAVPVAKDDALVRVMDDGQWPLAYVIEKFASSPEP